MFMSSNTPYNKPISSRYALDLRARAKLGGEKGKKALEEMIARNNALAKVANQRLSRLEKAGFTRYAYDRAISYTESEFGMTRFTTSREKLADIADLQINIQEMSKFIDSAASTVSGNRAIDLSIVNTFRDKGVNIPAGKENEFLDLIASDEFEMLKKAHVDSGVAVNDMIELTSNYGASIEDIYIAWSKTVDEMRTYDQALEELGYKI